jgi:hypothetical protein
MLEIRKTGLMICKIQIPGVLFSVSNFRSHPPHTLIHWNILHEMTRQAKKNIPPRSLNMFVVQNKKKREIDKPLFSTSAPTFLQSPHSAMTKQNFSYVPLMTNFQNPLSQTVM